MKRTLKNNLELAAQYRMVLEKMIFIFVHSKHHSQK
jgi:hypothetical protein